MGRYGNGYIYRFNLPVMTITEAIKEYEKKASGIDNG